MSVIGVCDVPVEWSFEECGNEASEVPDHMDATFWVSFKH